MRQPSEVPSDKLIHAKENDFETVKRIFNENRKLFPHIRKDYLKGMIKRGTVVLENDVVIIYNFYKRNYKVGNVQSKKGDVVLSQIVAKNRDGSASKVLQRFFNHVKKPVYLTVRQDNEIARQFYLKNGMKLVGETSWVKGTMLGDVYLYEQ